jgi:hypothetical protein
MSVNKETILMYIKKILLPLILGLLIIGFLFLASNKTVAAAPPVEYKSTWDIHVDFLGNSVNADLTVQVWKFSGGVQTGYLTWTRNLDCSVPPSVGIAGNEAIFAGGDGIVCSVPSRRALIYNLTRGAYLPPVSCDCKAGAFTTSEVALYDNTTGQTLTNPIFQMADLSLDAIMPSSPNPSAIMHFTVDGQSADSSLFSVIPGINNLKAEFDQVNEPNSGDLAYEPGFIANIMTLFSFPDSIEEDLAISNKKTDLFIGDGLIGRIRSLDIDPGCFPTG